LACDIANGEGFSLSDGATVAVTVATFIDRTSHIYGAAIEPDQLVDDDDLQLQTVAAEWIHAISRTSKS